MGLKSYVWANNLETGAEVLGSGKTSARWRASAATNRTELR